jgi:rhodanese-related sulfurtransferase
MPRAGVPPVDATLIVPGLWVGNMGAALSPAWLARNGIEAVFNCTRDVPFAASGGPAPPRRHYRVPVDDNLQPAEIARLARLAPEAVFKVLREHGRGRPVLIHCYAGMQRSAAVAAMYLMATRGMDADDAVALLRRRRPVTFFPAANFMPALRSWDAALRSCAAAPAAGAHGAPGSPPVSP